MKNYIQLKKNLKKDFSAFNKVKIAILGDTATQFLGQGLRAMGYEYDLDLDIWEADFNQIPMQVMDTNSNLYQFNPDIVIIFQSSHKLLQKYNKTKTLDQQVSLAQNELDTIQQYQATIEANTKAKIIYFNYPEIDDAVFGNFSNKLEHSFLFQLRELNYKLMKLASEVSNLYLCDLSSVQNEIGKNMFFQSSIYINTDMVLSLDALPKVAKKTLDTIAAITGKFKKCLILDLDNTMWGGVIGDDGLENIEIGSLGIGKAFSEFQLWAKKLKERGVILAVCSKNTESVAKEPFEKHPDMVLRLDDISVFVANWENKADNIRQIQSILNIGFDSMVFLDDNPFERNIVRENIPEITVPELPEDPAEYLEFLYREQLFETAAYSQNDNDRTKQYQTEAKRVNTMQSFTNEEDFLKSLDMASKVEPFNTFNSPRVSQLTQRSNQFNLRTMRYDLSDIQNISDSKDHFTFAFSLEDKFGDNGLICVIILKKENEETLFIDTWLMSCRVLKRGMENFTLNTLVDFSKENGFKYLKGEYIETPKNKMVENHYSSLGFSQEGDYWLLNTDNFEKKNCHINNIANGTK